jgi:hypothetical protein
MIPIFISRSGIPGADLDMLPVRNAHEILPRVDPVWKALRVSLRIVRSALRFNNVMDLVAIPRRATARCNSSKVFGSSRYERITGRYFAIHATASRAANAARTSGSKEKASAPRIAAARPSHVAMLRRIALTC